MESHCESEDSLTTVFIPPKIECEFSSLDTDDFCSMERYNDLDSTSESNSDSDTETQLKQLYSESESPSSQNYDSSEASGSPMHSLLVDVGLTLPRGMAERLFETTVVCVQAATESAGHESAQLGSQIPTQETTKKQAILSGDEVERLFPSHSATDTDNYQGKKVICFILSVT